MEILVACILVIFLLLGLYEYLYRLVKYRGLNTKKYFFSTNFSSFINYILITIPYICYCGLISLFTILTLPITWIRILAVHFSFSTWSNVYYPSIKKKIKKVWDYFKNKLKKLYKNINDGFHENSVIKDHLKIFKDCIQLYVNGDNLRSNSHIFKIALGTAIVLLQFGISFPTTLAGSKLFFSSISFMAPYIFTIVVQGLIVGFSMNAFVKNKRGKLMKLGLWGTVTVSVIFSYTGIVIAQDSPENTYQAAYETYETSFKATKNQILGKLLAENEAKESIKQVISTLRNNVDVMRSIQEIKENQLDGIPTPNQFYVNSVDENGNPVTRVIEGVFENAAQSEAEKAKVSAEIVSIENAIAEFEELPAQDALDSHIDNYLNEMKNKNETNNGNDDTSNLITTERLKSWIKQSNDINTSIADNVLSELSETTIDDINSKYQKYNTFNDINIKTSNDIFDVRNIGENNEEIPSSNTNQFNLIDAFKFWDIALSDDMSSLANYHKEIRNEAQKSFEKIQKNGGFDYLDNDSVVLFEQSKDSVMNVPSVFSYALETVSQAYRNPVDYIAMFFMALLIDVGSAILGYFRQGKTESFLYVRTSKDYYNEYDDLFEILFMSLMEKYEIKIQNGKNNQMNPKQFENECLSHMAKTSELINDFLKEFEISKATWNLGFNFICDFEKETMNKYKPLISILLKTNLLKIISDNQYQMLLKHAYPYSDYIKESESKNTETKYYLLLRNKGENYLRESIPVHYTMDENSSEVKSNE